MGLSAKEVIRNFVVKYLEDNIDNLLLKYGKDKELKRDIIEEVKTIDSDLDWILSEVLMNREFTDLGYKVDELEAERDENFYKVIYRIDDVFISQTNYYPTLPFLNSDYEFVEKKTKLVEVTNWETV